MLLVNITSAIKKKTDGIIDHMTNLNELIGCRSHHLTESLCYQGSFPHSFSMEIYFIVVCLWFCFVVLIYHWYLL